MAELTNKKLAENLKAAIKASGLTQTEVAKRIGVTDAAFSRTLKGEHKISALQLALICTATGSDVLGILEAEPLHGPSYRAGSRETWVGVRRMILNLADDESLSPVRRLDNIRNYLDDEEECQHPTAIAVLVGDRTVWLCSNRDCMQEFVPTND